MTPRTRLLLSAALAGAAALGWRALRPKPRDESALLGPEDVRRLYDRLASVYDALAAGYRLVGGGAYRRRAVEALALRPGATVVDLACGTGANFPLLVEAVGPSGRVVGVDLSPGMLGQARERVEAKAWTTVELVEADVRQIAFPEPLHGVLSTFGLEMVPEHDAVIGRAVDALAPGGRIVVGGLRRPERWPEWLIRAGEIVNRPFGVSRAYEGIQPWRSVETRTAVTTYEEHLLGAAYLASGTKPAAP